MSRVPRNTSTIACTVRIPCTKADEAAERLTQLGGPRPCSSRPTQVPAVLFGRGPPAVAAVSPPSPPQSDPAGFLTTRRLDARSLFSLSPDDPQRLRSRCSLVARGSETRRANGRGRRVTRSVSPGVPAVHVRAGALAPTAARGTAARPPRHRCRPASPSARRSALIRKQREKAVLLVRTETPDAARLGDSVLTEDLTCPNLADAGKRLQKASDGCPGHDRVAASEHVMQGDPARLEIGQQLGTLLAYGYGPLQCAAAGFGCQMGQSHGVVPLFLSGRPRRLVASHRRTWCLC